MSLAAVGSGQHYNIPGAPPAPSTLALYFRYAPQLYTWLLALLLGAKDYGREI